MHFFSPSENCSEFQGCDMKVYLGFGRVVSLCAYLFLLVDEKGAL